MQMSDQDGTGLTAGSHVFKRTGDVWTIALRGRVAYFRSYRGLTFIAHLLRHPGHLVHVLELTAEVAGPARGAGCPADGWAATPVFDGNRWAAYERRLAGLREERDEAVRNNHPALTSLLAAEIERLTGELREMVAPVEQQRRPGSPTERARVTVKKAIVRALRKLAHADAALGCYFGTTIHTGTWCSFTPDPRVPLAWVL